MYIACPECGLVFGREEGYFTGAMIVSYMIAVPLLAILTAVALWRTSLRFEWALLVAGVYFLPFVPAVFRYSRVIWMHFDRMVDPTMESERYISPRRPVLKSRKVVREEHRTDSAA